MKENKLKTLKDVKEFIRLLKEEIQNKINLMNEEKITHSRKISGTFQYHRNMKIKLLKEILNKIDKLSGGLK